VILAAALYQGTLSSAFCFTHRVSLPNHGRSAPVLDS
jgi:hypothetical protein